MGKLDPYYRISKVTGLNIQLGSEGQLISLCSVEASGNQLDIIKKKTGITVLAQLKEMLPTKTVIALNLSGKGILLRRIDRAEAIDAGIFSAILPNAKLEEFYVQNFISGEYSFVSIVRKSEADRWISGLGELGFEPLMLNLGVFPVEQILSQVNIYEAEAVIAGQLVERNQKGEWVNVQSSDTEPQFVFKLGSEKIDQSLLVPYAAAFQLVMVNQLDPIAADVKGLQQALESRLAEQKLKVQGALVLAAIFILLLANFILLSWLNSSNAALSEQVGKFAQNSNNEQQMAERIKEKEALLHTLGWDGGVNKSVLIDQVASLLPHEVKLREITVNPVDVAGSGLQKGTVFYDRKLVISGNSEKIIPVNEWIARIETRAWVKHIRLENFTYNNELNTGQFTVSIDY